VSSKQNEGSTFSFYIKSRRAPAPQITSLTSNPQTTESLPTRSKADIISRQAPDKIISFPRLQDQETKKLKEAEEERKYHILIVEDNLINQRVLSNQLKKLGCVVHVANHGLEALDLLSQTTYSPAPSPPTQSTPTSGATSPAQRLPTNPTEQMPLSVILMDVEMPIMDGLTCTRRIRSMEASGQLIGHVPIISVSANARREQVEQAREAGVDDAISKPFRVPELMSMIRGLGIKGMKEK
jgi:CheY-like chemotaxis protein